RNLVTGQIIGKIELFHNTHWSAKEGWENNEVEARYNQMVEMRSSQVRSEDGVLLTEDQIVEKVLGARSSYIKLQGPLPQKGSKHIKSSTTTSDSNEIENAYKKLQNWKEKTEAKYVRLLNFIKTRFPDFTNEDDDDSTNSPPNTPLDV
ncbi:hypothetical protein TorRG33x02_259650, partial [Trema orientale]